jgi:mRNA interferase YafQ
MLEFKITAKYRKDFRLMISQSKNISLLDDIIDKLCKQERLDPKHHDHPLQGNYIRHRECHIESDWLLIYRIDNEALILTAVRTGSHSDLF